MPPIVCCYTSGCRLSHSLFLAEKTDGRIVWTLCQFYQGLDEEDAAAGMFRPDVGFEGPGVLSGVTAGAGDLHLKSSSRLSSCESESGAGLAETRLFLRIRGLSFHRFLTCVVRVRAIPVSLVF